MSIASRSENALNTTELRKPWDKKLVTQPQGIYTVCITHACTPRCILAVHAADRYITRDAGGRRPETPGNDGTGAARLNSRRATRRRQLIRGARHIWGACRPTETRRVYCRHLSALASTCAPPQYRPSPAAIAAACIIYSRNSGSGSGSNGRSASTQRNAAQRSSSGRFLGCLPAAAPRPARRS